MQNYVSRRYSYIAYIATLTGSAGYYGYYLKNKEYLFIWVIVFVAGVILLGIKNSYIYKIFHSKFVYLDILYILIICFLPSILKWPNGLDILMVVIIGSIYGYIITSKFY